MKSAADSVIIDWIDTREVRPDQLKLYAFVNDNEREVSGAVIDALSNYEIVPVLWSQRTKSLRH